MKKLIKRILKEESKTDTPTPEEVKKNDGEVRAYRVTNQDTGEMINVDRSHEMWPEVSNAARKGNPRKVKQLSKGQEGKKLNEFFGFLKGWCCWFRGGCCTWEQDIGSFGGMNSWTVQWDGCCGNSGSGGCCGPEMIAPPDDTPGETIGESDLRRLVKRILKEETYWRPSDDKKWDLLDKDVKYIVERLIERHKSNWGNDEYAVISAIEEILEGMFQRVDR